ncbi:hypothetical protein FACS189444_5170 [Spirochaetia bacterium]|nr:hypothetical protein FACS189444_5170 [Spirochaetia bacterium]
MTDTATVSRLTAYFNRLPVERQSEILGIAEAFAFTQRGADSDPWAAMRGILREPLTEELAGKAAESDSGAAVGLGVNARKRIYPH